LHEAGQFLFVVLKQVLTDIFDKYQTIWSRLEHLVCAGRTGMGQGAAFASKLPLGFRQAAINGGKSVGADLARDRGFECAGCSGWPKAIDQAPL
jgi:hypothetical protein